jgi:ABC-type uncharacterized transport system ATPase subunit
MGVITHQNKQPMLAGRLRQLLDSVQRPRITPESSDAIVVESLAKRYPNGTHAVRGLSFRVGAGEVFGILGPNGAGKSTTVGMLGTLVRQTGGRATVAGYYVARHPRMQKLLNMPVSIGAIMAGRLMADGARCSSRVASSCCSRSPLVRRSRADLPAHC